jgi:hypothetical protein
MDDAAGNPSRSHGRVRRTALILLSGAAGLVIGFVLLTALARPASAAPVLSGVIPPAATVVGSPPESPVSSNVGAVPAVAGVVADVAHAVAPTMEPAVNPTALPPVAPLSVTSIPPVAQELSGGIQTLSGAVSSTATTLSTVPVVGTVLTATVPPVGSALTVALDGSVAASTGRSLAGVVGHLIPSRTTAGFTVSGSGSGRSPTAPATPSAPLPLPSAPLQNTPLTANDATGSTVGQGGGLFGSPPPVSLLPPVSSIGDMRPAGEKVPQLLLASRCTPPG